EENPNWKESNRYRKLKIQVAKLHEEVKNKRMDNCHKVTNRLTQDWDTIGIETLNIQGMLQNKYLAKGISDAGMYEIERQLKYKGDRTGANVHKIDRFYPSSKTC